MKDAIEIKGIEIKYGCFTIIKDFNLQIKEGEILTLFGPSGCGKSTILKTVLGQIPIANGEITIDKIDYSLFNAPIAYTPQSNELLPWKNVIQNISFWHSETVQFKNENGFSPEKAISVVELDQQSKMYPNELSGGMERRAALARCLATNSKFMFLDEAFVSVERRLRRKLMVEIRDLIKQNNMTGLIISHDYEEAVFMSDRIVELSANPTIINKIHSVSLLQQRTSETFDTPLFEENLLTVFLKSITAEDK